MKLRWWLWLAYRAPFSSSGRQWQESSHSCHLFRRQIIVNRSQSLLKGFSNNVLASTGIVSLNKTYGKQLWKLDTCCTFLYRSQCYGKRLANNISGQPTLMSYQFLNALQVDHCGDDLSCRNRWFLGRMRGFDTRTLLYHFPSPPKDLLHPIWAFLLFCHWPAAWRVIISYFQYWRRDYQELSCFEKSSRTCKAGEEQLFCIWRSDRKEKSDLSKV